MKLPAAIKDLEGFLKRHRSLVAVAVALYAVWRYGRYLGVAWLQVRNLPFVDGPVQFLVGHWAWATALGVVIFVTVFVAVRYALGRAGEQRLVPATADTSDDAPKNA